MSQIVYKLLSCDATVSMFVDKTFFCFTNQYDWLFSNWNTKNGSKPSTRIVLLQEGLPTDLGIKLFLSHK